MYALFCAPGLDVYTEAEIERGVAPTLFLPFEGHERVPDLLIGQGGQYEWIEIEHAPKPRSQLDSLVALADFLLASTPNEATPTNLLVRHGKDAGIVHRSRFVCPPAATARACWRAFERYGLERLVERYPHDIILERVQMSSGMVWGGTLMAVTISELYRESTGE